jgi:RHS repeat-associated protein
VEKLMKTTKQLINLIKKGNSYTISGDSVIFALDGEEYWEYEYDLLDRLTKVRKNGTTVAEYIYNHEGLRIKKDNINSTTYYTFGLNGEVLYEQEDTGYMEYIYIGGQHFARVDGDVISGLSTTYFYHTDHLGSTVLVTNASDEIVWSTEYTPFGNLTMEEGQVEFTSAIKFTGKDLDEDTGLYYYNARWYDAEIGRFISADTYKGELENPQTLNLYVYVANNPLIYVDPSGNKIVAQGGFLFEDLPIEEPAIKPVPEDNFNLSNLPLPYEEVGLLDKSFGARTQRYLNKVWLNTKVHAEGIILQYLIGLNTKGLPESYKLGTDFTYNLITSLTSPDTELTIEDKQIINETFKAWNETWYKEGFNPISFNYQLEYTTEAEALSNNITQVIAESVLGLTKTGAALNILNIIPDISKIQAGDIGLTYELIYEERIGDSLSYYHHMKLKSKYRRGNAYSSIFSDRVYRYLFTEEQVIRGGKYIEYDLVEELYNKSKIIGKF